MSVKEDSCPQRGQRVRCASLSQFIWPVLETAALKQDGSSRQRKFIVNESTCRQLWVSPRPAWQQPTN